MNLKYMVELQGGLMEHIKKAKGLKVIPLKETLSALIVEVAELMNEVKHFKYWSDNANPTEEAINECVDVLHFVLQTAILLDLTDMISRIDVNTELFARDIDIDAQFKGLLSNVLRVEDAFNYKHKYLRGAFGGVIEYFFGLVEMLGFSFEELEKAYEKKNLINHRRQQTGY